MIVVLAKSSALWSLLMAAAILNGALRDFAITPVFGAAAALPLSGISLSLLIFLVTVILLPRLGTLSSGQCRIIGVQWLCMTLLFEFVFGCYVAGKSAAQLLQAYDVTTGNLWVLVLLVTLVSPCLAARLRARV